MRGTSGDRSHLTGQSISDSSLCSIQGKLREKPVYMSTSGRGPMLGSDGVSVSYSCDFVDEVVEQ